MLQSLATLGFAMMAVSTTLLIAWLVADEWDSVRLALGLGRSVGERPLPPRVRMMAARSAPILRVTLEELRLAA